MSMSWHIVRALSVASCGQDRAPRNCMFPVCHEGNERGLHWRRSDTLTEGHCIWRRSDTLIGGAYTGGGVTPGQEGPTHCMCAPSSCPRLSVPLVLYSVSHPPVSCRVFHCQWVLAQVACWLRSGREAKPTPPAHLQQPLQVLQQHFGLQQCRASHSMSGSKQ